ncbi:hypothetical protein [Arthrobacter sp. H14-L1]|nr:hypothetical protein [Arthrobacter sp. H14-L1]MCY0906216.1 hypothetical protein [Arthrobacter sp. H14-L1]
MADGLVIQNATIVLSQDLGKPRGDMWEGAIWEDLITIVKDEAYQTY